LCNGLSRKNQTHHPPFARWRNKKSAISGCAKLPRFEREDAVVVGCKGGSATFGFDARKFPLRFLSRLLLQKRNPVWNNSGLAAFFSCHRGRGRERHVRNIRQRKNLRSGKKFIFARAGGRRGGAHKRPCFCLFQNIQGNCSDCRISGFWDFNKSKRVLSRFPARGPFFRALITEKKT